MTNILFVLSSTIGWLLSNFINSHKGSSMKTLKDFGYKFDEDGKLKNIDGSGEGFVFSKYDNHSENQKRYEALGEVINESIYKLLEERTKLTKIVIPIKKNAKAYGFIFASEDYAKKEKLMLIIHGSGVVRAGQWSRKLIINNSLNEGSQIPYIEKAKELGYGVLVLNSNQNVDKSTRICIQGSEDPERHFCYVWNNIVKQCAANHIAIVAHSYGGVITVHEADTNSEMRKKVFAVAFTDSVHGYMRSQPKKSMMKWMKHNVRNWVSSDKPLDTPLHSYDCDRVSAGTQVHEETSWSAFESVWKYIETKWNDRISNEDGDQSSDHCNILRKKTEDAEYKDVKELDDVTKPKSEDVLKSDDVESKESQQTTSEDKPTEDGIKPTVKLKSGFQRKSKSAKKNKKSKPQSKITDFFMNTVSSHGSHGDMSVDKNNDVNVSVSQTMKHGAHVHTDKTSIISDTEPMEEDIAQDMHKVTMEVVDQDTHKVNIEEDVAQDMHKVKIKEDVPQDTHNVKMEEDVPQDTTKVNMEEDIAQDMQKVTMKDVAQDMHKVTMEVVAQDAHKENIEEEVAQDKHKVNIQEGVTQDTHKVSMEEEVAQDTHNVNIKEDTHNVNMEEDVAKGTAKVNIKDIVRDTHKVNIQEDATQELHKVDMEDVAQDTHKVDMEVVAQDIEVVAQDTHKINMKEEVAQDTHNVNIKEDVPQDTHNVNMEEDVAKDTAKVNIKDVVQDTHKVNIQEDVTQETHKVDMGDVAQDMHKIINDNEKNRIDL